MATTKGFICPGCGMDHEGLPTDRAFKLPDEVWAIPESERSERAKFNTDLCQFGDRFFMRCILYVPFTWRDDAFGWGVWAEVSEETFYRYVELFDKDATAAEPARGKLANALSLYPDADGQELTIEFNDASSRPTLRTLPDSSTSLAVEQREGIDQQRYHNILHEIGAL